MSMGGGRPDFGSLGESLLYSSCPSMVVHYGTGRVSHHMAMRSKRGRAGEKKGVRCNSCLVTSLSFLPSPIRM